MLGLQFKYPQKILLMDQRITIAELGPSTRGAYSLRFEVLEAKPTSGSPDQISCTVADESGCINAFFNNHGKHIKAGQVYQLQGLRCKVVDHFLRLELIKESKITRVKYEMAFKDEVNNLSQKFYVSKAEQDAIDSKIKAGGTVKTEQLVQKEKEKSQEQTKSSGKQIKQEKQTKKDVSVIPETSVKSQIKPKKEERSNQPKVQKDYSKDYNQKREQDKDKSFVQKQQEKPTKKKYVEKKLEPKRKSPQKYRDDSKQRTYLKDIHLYRQKDVNLFVQVHTSTALNSNKYVLMKVCDSSGSTYLQFDQRAHLENKAWYCLRRFKVFGDKKYGYIASQQEFSTFDMLDEFNEIPENKPIYYPAPK